MCFGKVYLGKEISQVFELVYVPSHGLMLLSCQSTVREYCIGKLSDRCLL